MFAVAPTSKGGRPQAVQPIQGKRRKKGVTAQTVSQAYLSLVCAENELECLTPSGEAAPL